MTNSVSFTDAWLRKIAIGDTRKDYRDVATRGLQLRVSPSGVKTFSFVFRLGSKSGRVTIGKYPDVELKAAREKADGYRKLVAKGTDPRLEKKQVISKQDMSVEKMSDMFIEKYAKPKNKSWDQAETNLRLYILPHIGKMSIADVKRMHIHEILDGLMLNGKYATANRSLAHAKKFFGWLTERGYLEHSPADHIKRPYDELKRDRVLTDHEIKLIWDASNLMTDAYSSWIKLMFFCGQRRRETATMRRSQISENCWTLSNTDTKNKLLHVIPLPLQAQQLVDRLLTNEGEYLIKSGRSGDSPINGFSKPKIKVDELSGVSDWTFHDIRRTVSTNLSKLGVDRFIIRKLINHSDNEVTAIYDRYSYLNEKREALQQWADRLDDIVR